MHGWDEDNHHAHHLHSEILIALALAPSQLAVKLFELVEPEIERFEKLPEKFWVPILPGKSRPLLRPIKSAVKGVGMIGSMPLKILGQKATS